MRPTLREIARRTGYSTATVSRALAGSELISAATRRVILAAARETGYLEENCREVAVIVPFLATGHYFSNLIDAVTRELEFEGFIPVMISLRHLSLLERLPFCGALSLLSHNGFEAYWGERHILPLVCINTSPRHLDGIFMAGSNDAQGMRLLVEHLIALGHKRIGRIGGSFSFDCADNWNSHARDTAFSELMAEHNLPDNLRAITGHHQSFIDGCKTLVEQKATAIITLSEGHELPLMHALRLLNLRIPQDISIAGLSYANTASQLNPTFTCIEQNYELLGRHGCTMFKNLLSGTPPTHDILVNYHFHPGASTAPPSAKA